MSILELYLKGGWVMHLILLCSLVALYVIVERWLELRRAREIPKGFASELRNFISKNDVQSAQLYVTRFDVPVSRVVHAGLRKVHRGPVRVQQAMEDQGQSEATNLEKHMGILATMAGVAPLLGFLGTVYGISLAFSEIASHGGEVSADLLADGISQALHTTVFGLIVGIPAFAAYNYLQSSIQQTLGKLEISARELFDVLEEDLPDGQVTTPAATQKSDTESIAGR
jgi:biopolymer transport protein ExbB